MKAELLEALAYDPNTGAFTWKLSPNRRIRVGAKAGSLSGGYVTLEVKGKPFKAHRVAWLFVHGDWPAHPVDHINGVRSDNRIANLRDVPQQINAQNRHGAQSNSQSRLLGASPHQGRWMAQIGGIAGKKKYLGMFDTAELAHAAYLTAKRAHHVGNTL